MPSIGQDKRPEGPTASPRLMHVFPTTTVTEANRTAGLTGLLSFLLINHQGLRRNYDSGSGDHRPVRSEGRSVLSIASGAPKLMPLIYLSAFSDKKDLRSKCNDLWYVKSVINDLGLDCLIGLNRISSRRLCLLFANPRNRSPIAGIHPRPVNL